MTTTNPSEAARERAREIAVNIAHSWYQGELPVVNGRTIVSVQSNPEGALADYIEAGILAALRFRPVRDSSALKDAEIERLSVELRSAIKESILRADRLATTRADAIRECVENIRATIASHKEVKATVPNNAKALERYSNYIAEDEEIILQLESLLKQKG